MILESKEELLRQITQDWELLVQADSAFEKAITELTETHKDIRRAIMSRNDKATVRGVDGMDTTRSMDTRDSEEARSVHGVPHVRKKYVLHP